MFRDNRLAWLSLLTGLILFGWGMWSLFNLRFEAGEMYPVYSTFRSDPMGAKGLYLALNAVPGVASERHYQALSKLKTDGPLTFFYLGVPSRFLTRSDQGPIAEQMERLAGKGARIVLSFKPSQMESAASGNPCLPPHSDPPAEETGKDGCGDGHSQECQDAQPASQKWSVGASPERHRTGEDRDLAIASLQTSGGELPRELPLHTDLRFEISDPSWSALYTVNQRPVIMERQIGAGSLVLVADGYLFSNEAMRDARFPALLSWVIGTSSRIVFDEFHFGVQEEQGVMDLVRRHGLVGFLVSLVALALLLVWKNAVSFVPNLGPPVIESHSTPSGKDQLNGLVQLLRRNLHPGQALHLSFEEWDRSVGQQNLGLREKRLKIKTLCESQSESNGHQDPTEVYNQITRILSERESL